METVKQRSSLAPHLEAQRIAFAPLMFQAARAARDMGILAALDQAGSAGLHPNEVAAQANVSRYAARVLLEACLSLNLVNVDGWQFRIARAGRLILHDEMTRVNMDFVHHVCYRGAFELQKSLQERRPEGLATLGDWATLYEGMADLPPEVRERWLAFDHFYSDKVFPPALDVVFERSPRRILDVGGNTGRFAVACAARDPGVKVTIIDHPGQLTFAAEAAREAGASYSIECVPMDLLVHEIPFPHGYDVVWMSQLLDCFPEEDIVALLRRGAAALSEEGRLYINETYWDRQPNEVGRLCLHASSLYFAAIANGKSRMYHSEDVRNCVDLAGLLIEADRPLGSTHTLYICRQPA